MDVKRSIIREGQIIIYSCSQTVKTINFKKNLNWAEHKSMNICPHYQSSCMIRQNNSEMYYNMSKVVLCNIILSWALR